MASMYEADYGTAYYRSNDPIKNFKIRVLLKKLSAFFPDESQHSSPPGATGLELQVRGKEKRAEASDAEEAVIGWQQKIFSQREIEHYSQPENCKNVLDLKYHYQVTSLLNKRRQKNRIFTYVDHDRFSYEQEDVSIMTSYYQKPSPLAVKMGQVRCRRIGGRQLRQREQGSIPKSLIVEEQPSEEAKLRNHLEAPPRQVMYIMADLSPSDRPADESDEYILCSLKVDANGVFSVRPDFSSDKKPYSVQSSRTREAFDYLIEHTSKDMSHQEQERELRMYREMYARHSEFIQSCVGHEFELPPVDTLRVIVHGEIVSAQDFEKDNLYVQMFIDLPKNWTAERSQQLSWVTQSCATRSVHQTETAYFSFPFNFELMYKKNQVSKDSPEEVAHFPRLMIEVGAFDSWSRHFHEGYSFIQLPSKPGIHTATAHCWRPTGDSQIYSNLRRFFTGGTPEIEDPTYAAIPSTFDGTYLSKFGFRTQATGTVTVRFNTMWQSRAFMDSKASQRPLGSLLGSLGVSSADANITSVLEAFKRARMKMVQAREAATKELLREVKPIQPGELDS